MSLNEQIENDIISLKQTRFKNDKIKRYNLIASRFSRYFNQRDIKIFDRSLILSFFPLSLYPKTTRDNHVKGIIQSLKEKGIITNDKKTKTTKQRRVYSLKSEDFNSYFVLMKKNGFNKVDYFKFECNSEGIPVKKKVATSNINGLPVDKNGNVIIDYNFSQVRQTIPRRNQGVYSYGNKSIAYEKRDYSVKCFRVIN